VLLVVGVFLAATRGVRTQAGGAFAAACASVLYVWLVFSVATATSAVASAIYAWGMFMEARVASPRRWAGRGDS